MDQFIGKMLDNRYELLEIVGTGGMAVVYRAKCHRLNRFVAVKILKPEAAQDPELRKRFRDESQAVAMLSHPNIVAVYDVSKTQNMEYIVMELIDGITLKQYIRQKGGFLPWKEALHFITQVMRALRHAHSRGIIHRDIKPHNIMVLRDGSCKVADFGIACLGNAQSTNPQEALGSVHYIAPEQAKGARVDARTDIYSAGVVLYEMLVGKVPYEGNSPVEVALQHMQTEPPLPGSVQSNIPLGLEQITMKAMALKPGERYDSARAMLVDLDTLRKNPKYVFPYTIGKEPLTKIPKVSDEDDTQLTPVVTGVPTRVRPEHRRGYSAYTEAELGSTRRKKKSNKGPILVVIIAILLCLLLAGAFFVHTLSGLNSGTAEEIAIPDLVGMLYDDAVSAYGDSYTIVIGSYVEDNTQTAGVILDQDPEAAYVVKQDKPTITVKVCIHSDSITMPDLTGATEAELLAALEEAGIDPSNIIKGTSVYSDTVEAGYVVYTSPAAGSPIASNATVTYYLSKGVDPETPDEEEEEDVTMVEVPDFVGSSRTQVLAQLKSLGLTGSFTDVSNSAAAGTVLSQSVDAGEEVAEGTTIYFTVSSGEAASSTENSSQSSTSDTSTSTETETPSETEDTTTDDSSTTTDSSSSSSGSSSSSSTTVSVDKSYTVSLPSDSDEVSVVVKVGDSTVYSRSGVDTSQGSLTVTISGSGTQTVSVYIDGTLQSSESVTFN